MMASCWTLPFIAVMAVLIFALIALLTYEIFDHLKKEGE